MHSDDFNRVAADESRVLHRAVKMLGNRAARRDGMWAHYRITPPENKHSARVLRDIEGWLKTDNGDYHKLLYSISEEDFCAKNHISTKMFRDRLL